MNDTRELPENPLYWEYAAGGTNNAWIRLSAYCLEEFESEGVKFECCYPSGHTGNHGGYGIDANGVEIWAPPDDYSTRPRIS